MNHDPHSAPQTGSIYQVRGFLDAATCRRFRTVMDRSLPEAAEVLDGGAVLDATVRRASVMDVPSSALADAGTFLELARTGIEKYYGVPLGEREGPSFLRYGPGGVYRRHRDRGRQDDWPGASRRRMSVILFLSTSRGVSQRGEFDGGELVLFPDFGADLAALAILPDAGRLVAFPSDFAHEVRVVRSGVRDVIADWFY